ncbi:hypothetical protein ACLQ9R_18685 [Bordetella hinzii]|uniref:hypothetical protein n=1 Tax=Bordetella hinzii TaxID=103855 RepID=UPI0005B9AB7D|nr:hypothetical protein [Bordetella hinzii]
MTEVAYQNGWPVPAGWKLVAVEPTYEMECEVGGVRMDEESFLHEYADHEKIGEICRAVVKYSPPPPKAPDYNPGPLEVSVVGMPEFDALIDHIYEEGTSGGAVIQLANKLVRAAIQSHIQHARNAKPVAYKWGGVLIRAEESHPVHRKEGQPLYAAPVAAQTADDARDAADPLQGAADWLVKALDKPRPAEIAAHLLIGHNRAERLFDAAIAAQQGEGGAA